MAENVKVETYNDFVKQFGERPPDIVFSVTRQAVAREIKEGLEELDKHYYDNISKLNYPELWQTFWKKYGVA